MARLVRVRLAYPRIAAVVPNETVNATLEALQRAWDARTLDELKETFLREISTLPAEVRRELEKLVAKSGFDPLVIELVIETLSRLKFVEQRPACVSGIWAHERQTNDSNLRVFNELRL
jgi:hypothetical protein